MTAAQFRKIALSFAGAEERSHMNHPDFRIGGRIFATLGYPNKDTGCLVLTPEQQKGYLDTEPAMFHAATGAWGRYGSTMVNLAPADAEIIGAAMTLAWQNAVAKGPSKSKPAKKAVVTKASAKKPVAKKATKKAAKSTARRPKA